MLQIFKSLGKHNKIDEVYMKNMHIYNVLMSFFGLSLNYDVRHIICCPKCKEETIFKMAALSIYYHNGKYLKELIVLGLDINHEVSFSEHGFLSNVTLLTLAIAHKKEKIINILLSNGAKIDSYLPLIKNLESILLSGGRLELLVLEKLDMLIRKQRKISEMKQAACTLIGMRKFRGIYKSIDRFIFREIAISVWSSRNT